MTRAISQGIRPNPEAGKTVDTYRAIGVLWDAPRCAKLDLREVNSWLGRRANLRPGFSCSRFDAVATTGWWWRALGGHNFVLPT